MVWGHVPLNELGERLEGGANGEQQRYVGGHVTVRWNPLIQFVQDLRLLPLRVVVAEWEHIQRQERRLVAVQRIVPVVVQVRLAATCVLVYAGDDIAAGVQQAAGSAAGPAVEIDGQKLGYVQCVQHVQFPNRLFQPS